MVHSEPGARASRLAPPRTTSLPACAHRTSPPASLLRVGVPPPWLDCGWHRNSWQRRFLATSSLRRGSRRTDRGAQPVWHHHRRTL